MVTSEAGIQWTRKIGESFYYSQYFVVYFLFYKAHNKEYIVRKYKVAYRSDPYFIFWDTFI